MTVPGTGRGIADISSARLQALNSGTQSSNLTECLAIDFAALMRAALPDLQDQAFARMQASQEGGITARMALAARILQDELGPEVFDLLAVHPSDTVRGWACYVLGQAKGLSLAQRIAQMRPLADDPHFGVREWAWLALRAHVADDLGTALAELAALTLESSERLRRFACEATRPRGVWCAHLKPLRAAPERGLALLSSLRADPSRYVQDSVANWLNDAAKDQPDWVRGLCAEWLSGSPPLTTQYICKRAQRSIRK